MFIYVPYTYIEYIYIECVYIYILLSTAILMGTLGAQVAGRYKVSVGIIFGQSNP